MVKQKPVPYTHQDVTFLEDVSLPSTKKKKTQEPLLGILNVSTQSCLVGKLIDRGYL